MKEIKGNIVEIRKAEDCIRQKTNYREVFGQNHNPSQGDEKSVVITKVYWIFLNIKDELSWESSINDIVMYLIPEAIVRFWYNYKTNRAEIKVRESEWRYLTKEVPELKLIARFIEEQEIDRNGREASNHNKVLEVPKATK